MSDLAERFHAAVEQVQNAPSDGSFKPSIEYKLKMYSLFKQATDGDVSGKKPGLTNPVGRLKYGAWADLKGMSADDAMEAYLAEVAKVEAEHG